VASRVDSTERNAADESLTGEFGPDVSQLRGRWMQLLSSRAKTPDSLTARGGEGDGPVAARGDTETKGLFPPAERRPPGSDVSPPGASLHPGAAFQTSGGFNAAANAVRGGAASSRKSM
jgi:hypothetical protein